MPEPLTAIERDVYHYLLDFLTENTYQPSVREIGRRFHIKSTKTVSEILQSLAAKGYIERDPSRSRGVRLLGYQSAQRVLPVPCYDALGDGERALPERPSRYITVDRRFVPNEHVFFMRASGSVSTHAILAGDWVMIDPAATAPAGAVIAERSGEHAAFRVAQGGESPNAARTAPVLGTVCGVFRPLSERADDAPAATAG